MIPIRLNASLGTNERIKLHNSEQLTQYVSKKWCLCFQFKSNGLASSDVPTYLHMKHTFFLALLALATTTFGQTFVSPIGFVNNETNRARVVRFIEHQVKTDYTAIGMNDPMTLRMMEDENMKAFKQLIRATNTSLLKQVIDTYCGIGMCNYSTIWMMYQEQNKAAGSSLKW